VALIESRTKSESHFELQAEPGGYHSGLIDDCASGSLYGFRLNREGRWFPDPMSRFQPQGPHGPSQVVDPQSFEWTDGDWRGVCLHGQVMYEMHVGTFTPQGTWLAAEQQLERLADLGITLLEVMPLADFPGRFNWGYDGVNLFAPTRLYGTPDDVRSFINRAHELKLGVILDVVYNHLGPDGNYLATYSADYFRSDIHTDWGLAINFGGDNSGPVREFFLANAAYWIDEFHFDGLRLDATQDIHDEADRHILAEITRVARGAAINRSIIITAENEPQNTRLVQPPEKGGYGIDCIWNDDFHHSAMVALSGRNEAYYADYLGRPQEFISALKHGFLYQGQWYFWQKKPRGTSSRGLPPQTFVTFIQNHDQVANSSRGWRCHKLASPGAYRAMTALLLLGPNTPLLFQGQEFASSAPFHFFADHNPELAALVHAGRKEFMSQFPSVADPQIQSLLPNPADEKTFQACKLDLAEREKHADTYALHRDLLRLRRETPAFAAQGAMDGAVLGEAAFVLRFFSSDETGGGDRLLIVNLGRDRRLEPAPEPLLAPPAGMLWKLAWSTEDPQYGGSGIAPLDMEEQRILSGPAAIVLEPKPA
jgi:maltooligosyltrehalose trehalohydrolase